MIEDWTLQFDNLLITRDGVSTAAADRYMCDIKGIHQLKSTHDENRVLTFRKQLVVTVTEVNNRGKTLTLIFQGLYFGLLHNLETLRNTQKSGGSEIRLQITHPYDSHWNFDLDVNIDFIEYDRFHPDSFRDAVIQVTTFGDHT